MNETIVMIMLMAIIVVFSIVGFRGDNIRQKREAEEKKEN